eukprot:CAMPEP_0201665884 /NCGR_PEP_ID=MMETSP0494-20130426/6889_1 /ASSEMBLY_ACC=CAM_ASM_000839 /TAXON_ID=420259 /ORGANISM="Thalassiosira gravida, Strain GMp14c1" /LENGTH=149 /DNA_ID=CAMNT_0048144921 /DNA_START=154 /DNA_END=599 /DNA_ORIENTATION=-
MFNLLASTTARRSITAAARLNITALRPATGTTLPTSFARAFSDYDSSSGGDSGSGASSDKIKGIVKWFDPKKGFGFVTPDDGSPDVFVHHSAIHANGFRTLGDGESVEFEMVTEPNGKSKAIHVTGPEGGYVQGAPRRMDAEMGRAWSS